MRVGILGATDVQLADGPVTEMGGPRVRALLGMLALDAGQVVSTDQLIDGLYGSNPPSGATNALQSHVSRLRRALRSARERIELHPAGYRLRLAPEDVDAHRFESLAAAGRQALAAGDALLAARLLREALNLWRGPALADVADAPFRQAPAARLEELRCGALEDRMDAELALGNHRGLVAELQELVAIHPRRERLRGQLMLALHGGGRQAEALTVFDEARRMLAEQFGTGPGPELLAAHLAILRAQPSTRTGPAREPAASAGLPPSTSGRLPAQLTSFIGRDRELRSLCAKLRDARLLTLVGPGGVGKTRLAVEAAGRYPAEVCFVELAPLDLGVDVAQTVLDALGLNGGVLSTLDHRPGAARRRLVESLVDRPHVLLLDNCEHLVDAVGTLVAALLRACPALRILTTSRAPLGVPGEVLFPVVPLRLPPPGLTPEQARQWAAVRLFVDRATAAEPRFRLEPANVDAVVGICRALDGLPLAIELAAARVRSMPVPDLAARLADRFRLLSAGHRGGEGRHRSLRGVVAWSWDLLDHPERVAARRFTVFAGGASAEAVGRVCGLAEWDAVEVLAGLADKSLIELAPGSRRYRMLETVRLFCAERLAEAGEAERFRRAHTDYFLELAQTADPLLRGAGQLDWLERLDVERENLHCALRRYVESRDLKVGLRLVAALSMYWWMRGLPGGGPSLARDLLQAVGDHPPTGLEQEYVLCVVNAAGAFAGDGDLEPYLRVAESIVKERQLRSYHPAVALLWPMMAGITGRYGAEQVLRHNQFSADGWTRAASRLGLGHVELAAGLVSPAREQFEAALDGFRDCGERWGAVLALTRLAELTDWDGDPVLSLRLLDEAVYLAGQLGAVNDMAYVRCHRADTLVRSGELAAAEAEYERAADLGRRAGGADTVVAATCGLGNVARLRGDLARARQLQERALRACTAGWLGAAASRATVLTSLGRLAEAEGDPDGAAQIYHQALAASLSNHDFSAAAAVAEGLAGVALLRGQGERAAVLLGAGVALRGTEIDGDPDVVRTAAAARTLVGESAFAAAHRRGAALGRDQALQLADLPSSGFGAGSVSADG